MSEAEKAFEEAWNKNDIGPYDLQAMRWFHVGWQKATERAIELVESPGWVTPYDLADLIRQQGESADGE